MLRRLLAALLLLGASALPLAQAQAPPVTLDLSLRLDPGTRRLEASGSLRLDSAAAATLELGAFAEVSGLVIDGLPAPPLASVEHGVRRWPLPAGAPGRQLRLRWHATLAATPSELSHRDTLGAAQATADPRGSFLPAASGWYPRIVRDGQPELHAWRVVLDLPAGQRGLVPGSLLAEEEAHGRQLATFRMRAPAEGIDLIAGPYSVAERQIASADGRRLRLRTLFHAEIADLSDGYLDALTGYFALYEAWIGPYPFDDFSVVSSPTPTGFGMPTLTYLGIDVLRLPFIRASSLGHEVLHNWWGNGVYPDYAQGNWSEGLTTFMADYTYAQQASPDKAQAMRLSWLRELSAIPPGRDRPLAEFTARRHGVSAAVGYGKAAMFFSMLRDQLGPDTFDRAIRRLWQQHRFGVAGWRDLREAFEAEAGYALGDHFRQWIGRDGVPAVRLVGARQHDGRLEVSLAQDDPPFLLDLTLRIQTDNGSLLRRVRLSREQETLMLDVGAAARSVSLDPEYRALRRLARDEAPPVMREIQLAGDAALLVLGDKSFATTATALAGRLLEHAPRSHPEALAPGAGALLAIGPSERIDAWLAYHGLPPRPAEVGQRGDVQAWILRMAGGKPLLLVSARDAAALQAATRPLPHLGQPSWVVIEQGRTLARGEWPARPQTVTVD